MSQEQKPPFLKAIEYIPVITSIIIVLGCLRLVAFYGLFGVSIFDYTEFSDFLSQGISDLFKIIFYSVLGLCIPVFEKRNPFKSEIKNGIIDEETRRQNANKFFTLLEYLILSVGIAIFIENVVRYLKTKQFGTYEQLYLIGGLIYPFVAFICVHLCRIYLKYSYNVNKSVIVFLALMSIDFTGSFWSSFNLGLSVKYEQKNVGDSVIMEKDTLISTKDYYYIGQTKNYIFFHNEQKNNNDIFPKSKVAKMTFFH